MALPFDHPLKPMLAKGAAKLPPAGRFLYDPKWDGFRCLVFRDGDELFLQSRDSKPFVRYFPELLDPLRASLPERCVVDGELLIERDGRLDFDGLQQRIHPATSRVTMLSQTTPASFVAFDLLALDDQDLRVDAVGQRRELLEQVLADARPPVFLTPATLDRDVAQDWFERFEGAGLDGVMAKPLDGVYESNKRGWIKIKHQRTLDAVVCGFRWHKHGPGTEVGSLLLGLWADDGRLRQIGVASSFSGKRRLELAAELEPFREHALDDHPWAAWAKHSPSEHEPGATSRWNAKKDLSWEPVRLELVAEVTCNQLSGGRLRHPAKLLRFRHDKPPAVCGYDQLDVVAPMELCTIFAGG